MGRCSILFVTVLGLVMAQSALTQFPDKPIRLIVPQAPGSATDTVARLYAAELAKTLNAQIVVENRPGGAFTIGLDAVAKAAPDGYTLGLGPIGALATSPNMIAKIPYNIERDFQPIVVLARGHLLLTVSPHLPVNSVKELIAFVIDGSRDASHASKPIDGRAARGPHDRRSARASSRRIRALR